MATTALAGKTGWFKRSGVAQPMQEWSMRLSTSRVDITNFTSLGYSEFIAGFASGTVRAKGIVDPTKTQFTIGETLTLSLGAGGGYAVAFSGVLVDVNMSSGVSKAAEVDIEVVTNGVFTPTIALGV